MNYENKEGLFNLTFKNTGESNKQFNMPIISAKKRLLSEFEAEKDGDKLEKENRNNNFRLQSNSTNADDIKLHRLNSSKNLKFYYYYYFLYR